MNWLRRIGLALAGAALVSGWSIAPPVRAQTIFNTPYPSVIRVAIRAYNNPTAPILYVQTLGFEEYCEDVLPNEWIPSWNEEALKAGAIAVKMFAWYWTLHPRTENGWTFDVDNTTNYQTFKYLSGHYQTDLAIQQTWNMVYVPSDGFIKPLQYRQGSEGRPGYSYIGTYIMSQWGTEYWAKVAKLPFTQILSLFYPGYQSRWV
ncbi:SpoIID/LytB domain-containing protein [Alicyclobacillus mali]|uniref:SpoIID/LytB domain-containing protein n=1 Tax=Alicyclobacillus mali (ex Roth et al. 2021) TaxID=1123961 RepID=A0ABS0F6S2_9BACL|nr:SpoIID/LytB domain-containing protein [Alicyclobacillus mali (ex Roth et al. 2021)]MBF8378990.1 SpoIID/LytB domain-containing protein [Alicyclobacillus mali (ex Roth et al. 2021)]MCL6488168.1 SpoIID/LytB domain-containing protein [Alicyclobacillus mali (ex Roth et al. 2021)]